MTTFQHWKLKEDDNHILWLGFDRQGSTVNTMNADVLNELEAIIETVSKEHHKGMVIYSEKTTGFIAGADIEQFTKLDNTDDAVAFIKKGQQVLDKLEALYIPTVAMIEGFCMGGGLELALACRYRIAEDGDKTRLGLPEVKLGIHPGWGGTVRLPNLIGSLKAMDLILSGRAVRAKAAAKMGVVDAAVPKRQLKHAAEHYILNKPSRHQASRLETLTNAKLIRPLLAKVFRKQVAKKAAKQHYPSPYAVIDNWEKFGPQSSKAYQVEADSIGNLVVHNDTAKNLVRVFFLQERLKGLAKGIEFEPKHIHVIGAGVMGGDIAAWCALRGYTVTLQDREPKFIAPAVKRAYKLFKKKLKDPRKVTAAMDRLIPDVAGSGVIKADVIIEAIYENLEAKQALFQELEVKAKPDAILATNTSSIPLDEINTVMADPKRLVGIHYFNPVALMPLVEIVKGNKTDETVVKNATAFVRSIDKLPLPVKSSPGFLVNRVLMPYLMECMKLIEEGVAKPVIDKAATDFGMPMGPVELADTVGLDVCLSVAKNLTQHFGGEIPDSLIKMVERGDLGRKSGKGFYEYKKGKAIKASVTQKPSNEIASRLIMRMVNEAAACLREGVVEDAELLDAGMIFGTGFAPFRGGPMHYTRTFEKGELGELFNGLEQQFGERFKADRQLEG